MSTDAIIHAAESTGAGVVAVLVTAVAAFRFLFRPLWDKMIIASVVREDDAVRNIFAVELVQLGSLTNHVDTVSDSVEFLRESSLAQGKELLSLPLMADALDRTAKAQEQMGTILGEMQKESAQHSAHLANIEGFLEGGGVRKRRKVMRNVERNTP